MANTAPFTIVSGPAEVFVAAVGTPFPLVDSDPSTFGTEWQPLGQTDGGVKVTHSQTVNPLYTDQVTAPVKAIRSEEGLEIGFSLAEATLEHYSAALNQALIGPTIDVGDEAVYLYRGGFQVETLAMLVRGPNISPYGNFNLQYEVPAVYQSGAPEVEYTKANKAVLACVFTAIAGTLTPGGDVFGVLRASTA